MNIPKVLVVDDDSDILDLFEIFLYDQFQVTTAINGFEALNSVKKNVPDCIVTDIMMPVMDGIRLIKRIRQIDTLKDVPVIAVTAFSTVLQERSLTNVGFSAVISKPVSRKTLVNSIQESIGGKK